MKPNRRTVLRSLASAPLAAGFVWTDAEAQQAHHQAKAAEAVAQKTATPFRPKFFTRHEYATVTLLVDLIIPKDERSGSATEAGVPQFMDFMMTDQPARQTAMRGGLAWLDRECVTRFDKDFLASTPAERAQVLDDISWRRVLQQLPRPDRERILHQQDGDRRPAIHGQRVCARVDRLSLCGAEEAGTRRGDGLGKGGQSPL
jgi:gluconate 2-dehydrogenase gamma chain